MLELMFVIHLSAIELLQLLLTNRQDGCVMLQENFLTSLHNLKSTDCDVLGIPQSKSNKVEHFLLCPISFLQPEIEVV